MQKSKPLSFSRKVSPKGQVSIPGFIRDYLGNPEKVLFVLNLDGSINIKEDNGNGDIEKE